MSKIVIPSDWDNEEWDSFCIKWPKSIQYRGVLLGLIYSMTRGRAYDETTGSVRDAQEVGKRIFDANYPLSTCGTTGNSGNGTTNEPDYPYICNFGWCDSYEEDCEADDMSNCCMADKFKIENGVLSIFDCGKWTEIGQVGASGSTVPGEGTPEEDLIWVDEPDEGETPKWSCIKATACFNLFHQLVGLVLDNWDNSINPWASKGIIEREIGYDLTDTYVLAAMAECLKASAIGGSSLGDDLSTWYEGANSQQIICDWSKRFDNTSPRIKDTDMEVIKSSVTEWGWQNMPFEGVMLQDCRLAIGKSNFDAACIASANGNFDCGCPAVTPIDEIIPITHTWSKVFDFKLGAYGFTGDSALNTLEYQAGVGWVCTGLDGGAMNVPIMGRAGAVDDPFPCNLLYYKIHVAQWPTNLSVAGGTPMTLKVGGDWKGSAAVQRGSEYITMILPGEAFNLATRIEWGWNEYFNGSGNEGVQTVIDKLVIAGNGGDFWSMINPDGTVG